jgi:signal transduction histidine kinase
MLRSEDRLERLIENLIQFSLFAKGELTLQLTPVYIQEIFDEIQAKYAKKCKNKNISFKINTPKESLAINADSQKISWVLSQFMDNAIKFTEPGGQILLGSRLDDREVNIYVFDTGIGISQNKINEIFEPFHQLDGSSTRRYEGTGLGLAIAQQIIDAHGSNISVRSKVGEGSYFEFKLPMVTS